MKVTSQAILACFVIGAVNAVSIQNISRTGAGNTLAIDIAFLEKQRFLLEIVYRIENPLAFEEWIKLGGELVVNKSKYDKFNERMIKFYDSYKLGTLVPKGDFFSEMQVYQVRQGWGLFYFFYYAKDWDTFVRNAAWARLNVNEGMFVYALTLAVIQRPDMHDLILPSIYEILPKMFFNRKFCLKAEKFNLDIWNRQIMLEKELKTIYQKKYATEVIGNRFYMKDWKTWQWWKLMGLGEEWHLVQRTVLRDNIETFKNDPNYKDVWNGINAFWMPVDYTRDIEVMNEESKLSYFTEDVGWNAYWYYLNMDYARILNKKEHKLKTDRRGELWIFKVQQILARYSMERRSQGLGEVNSVNFYGTIKTGYNSQLMVSNGNGFTYRKNYFELESYQNIEHVNRVVNIERRIRDIIESGKFVRADGVEIDLTNPESIEFIGILLQGNNDVLDRNFFGFLFTYSVLALSGGDIDNFKGIPNALLNFETMLRDPITYQLFKKLVDLYFSAKRQLPAYKREDLHLPGVNIVQVNVSRLHTYFDLVDTDVTNLLNDKMLFRDGKFIWNKTLLARRMQLNHKPFEYIIKLMAEGVQNILINVFIGPSFNDNGAIIDMLDKHENFLLIDKFVAELTVGENVIKRSSTDFHYSIDDRTTYTELYRYLMLAYDGEHEFPKKISQPYSGYPNRLILPHGWVKGMPMKLFFIATPFTGTQEQFSTYGSSFRHVGDLPFGYPLDRKIDNIYEFLVPNMFYKDVKIYHTEKYEKYYPEKYEDFGTFDYNY